jgi:flagellar assembly factor FliW
MTLAPSFAASELTFADGLVGCPDWKRFKLEHRPDMEPVALLNSLDQANLSLIVADPRVWYPQFKFDVSPDDLTALQVTSPDQLAVLTIITVEPDPFAVTANLLGPLILNPLTGSARQIIQSAYPYLARQPLDLQVRPITLTEGLIGSPEWQHFLLRKSAETAPIKLLVSREQPGLSFPVVAPWLIDPNYQPRLDAEDRAALGAAQDGDLEWLCLLNVESNPLTVTANLLGPLVINQLTNVARQVVLSGSGYSAKHVVTGGNLEAAFKEVERASANPTN